MQILDIFGTFAGFCTLFSVSVERCMNVFEWEHWRLREFYFLYACILFVDIDNR